MIDVVRSSAGSLLPDTERKLHDIVEFWNQINGSDELAAAYGSVLGPLEREVAEALYQDPPDIVAAWSATARAFAYLSGTNAF